MKKRLWFLILALAAAGTAALFWLGVFQLNHPSAEAFPVRGVDVSHYQGTVDWDRLETQGVLFAYIKATEGSSFEDSAFQTNWENVAHTELRAGAYHFFSFESPGLDQAENFIHTVSPIEHMLPPVIDIEPYRTFRSIGELPQAVAEIRDWLERVESEYGMRPVIYTTEAFYRDRISDAFPGYDIWIRSVYKPPSESVRWKFWQYSNRVHLEGYEGEERFIDMNAFNGTLEAFEAYGQ